MFHGTRSLGFNTNSDELQTIQCDTCTKTHGYSPIDRGSDRPIIEKGPIDRGSFRPRA